MQLAVLADIHGNDIALSAILQELQFHKIVELLILGDIVGYYYFPDKVLDLLEDWEFVFVKGNHEGMMKSCLYETNNLIDIKKKYGSGLEYALKNLSQSRIDFLVNAPDSLTIRRSGLEIDLYHGAPWNQEQRLYSDSGNDLLGQCLETSSEIVLIGHSHYQFKYEGHCKTLINPGSVGQAREKGGIAQWALLDLDKKAFSLQETKYDPTKIINKAQQVDADVPYLQEVLER